MVSRTRSPRGTRLGSFGIVALVLLSLVLSACTSANQTKRNGPPQPLIIVPNTGGDLVQNFNPFLNGAVNSYGQFGPIYETLLFFNRANGSIKPWLADSATYLQRCDPDHIQAAPGHHNGRMASHSPRRMWPSRLT